MDQRQRPQRLREHRPEPERYEVGDLVQVRNQAPVDKLSSPWEKVFVVTRVLPNAVRCVRWRIDLHPPFKLRQEPKDMGQVEEKLVHVKDVKKWNSDLPPSHVWDEKLVETLLQSVEPIPESRSRSQPSSTASTVDGAASDSLRPDRDSPPGDVKFDEPVRTPLIAPLRMDDITMPSPERISPPRERYRFLSPEAPPTTENDAITLDDEGSMVDYYQLANQANELLQKTADGRRVYRAFQGNNRRFEKLFDAYREAQEQPGVVLGPPPRPTTIQDRLEDLVPGPRVRPLRTAQLNHILSKDITVELDIAGRDEERLREYERTYINAIAASRIGEEPQPPRRESNSTITRTPDDATVGGSFHTRPIQRNDTVADVSTSGQREGVGRTEATRDLSPPETNNDGEEFPDNSGLFETTPQTGTAYARMDAAFSHLESMWDDLSRRASLPNLPIIESRETSFPLQRTQSSDGLSPISRHVSRVSHPSSAVPQDEELGGSFIEPRQQ